MKVSTEEERLRWKLHRLQDLIATDEEHRTDEERAFMYHATVDSTWLWPLIKGPYEGDDRRGGKDRRSTGQDSGNADTPVRDAGVSTS